MSYGIWRSGVLMASTEYRDVAELVALALAERLGPGFLRITENEQTILQVVQGERVQKFPTLKDMAA